jgi:hypothetical protein
MEGLAMTNKHLAYDSSLNRDVCDVLAFAVLAFAVLVAFSVLILLVTP